MNKNNVSILGSSFSVGNFASRLQSGELRQKTPLWLKDDETTECSMHFFNTIKILLLVYRSALSLAESIWSVINKAGGN